MQENYTDQPHVEAQVAMIIANQAADNDNKVTVEQVRQQLAEEYPLAAVPFDDYVEKSDVLDYAQQPVTVTPARIRRFSQPMKALFELFRRFDARRIFGFIRRLGGMSRPKVKCYDLRSTHALRVEGDLNISDLQMSYITFLSTPSGWRATKLSLRHGVPLLEFLSTPSGWRATE